MELLRPCWLPLGRYFESSRVVEVLLEAGSEVDAPREDGGTPLMAAAFYNHSAVVVALLEAGANLSLRDAVGFSAFNR